MIERKPATDAGRPREVVRLLCSLYDHSALARLMEEGYTLLVLLKQLLKYVAFWFLNYTLSTTRALQNVAHTDPPGGYGVLLSYMGY